MKSRLADIARSQIGVREPGGRGIGLSIADYQRATDLPPGEWGWSAALVAWCIREWLQDGITGQWLRLQNTTPDRWRPRGARPFGMIQWARARARTVLELQPTAAPECGDIIVFEFSHCGIVVARDRAGIHTIEGNTYSAGTRDSGPGDGVWPFIRAPKLARALLRIRPSQ